MKSVILAGGLGTRISEETHLKPKPMIEIGGKPILWHIMKLYSVVDTLSRVMRFRGDGAMEIAGTARSYRSSAEPL